MIIAGYFASILIGFSLGLVGGGGSILTVPVLVYLFGIEAVPATSYSLFIVGVTSVIGSVSYLRKKLVNERTALIFGLPSIVAVFLTRNYLLPQIPEVVFRFSGITITKGILLLSLFAVLMLLAAYSMIRTKPALTVIDASGVEYGYVLVVAQGFFTGVITGLVGAGGGFLIIPALVNMVRMPMKKAIGTSLLIIAVNSLAGFAFSLPHTTVSWPLLWRVSCIAAIGMLIGSAVAGKIDGQKLKPAFGWFVLVMGLYVLAKETVLH